jgi:hypothetical protein
MLGVQPTYAQCHNRDTESDLMSFHFENKLVHRNICIQDRLSFLTLNPRKNKIFILRSCRSQQCVSKLVRGGTLLKLYWKSAWFETRPESPIIPTVILRGLSQSSGRIPGGQLYWHRYLCILLQICFIFSCLIFITSHNRSNCHHASNVIICLEGKVVSGNRLA